MAAPTITIAPTALVTTATNNNPAELGHSSSFSSKYFSAQSFNRFCNRNTVVICFGVFTLQVLAASSPVGCGLAVTCHSLFVLYLLWQNRRHSLSHESPFSSHPARYQRALRVWFFTFLVLQYLVYQCVVMTFREIYLLENVSVLILLIVAGYFAFQVVAYRSNTSTDGGLLLSPKVIDTSPSDGILHPHDCIWLGARVPSSGPIARYHLLAHFFMITAGTYGAHQTATAVCTPIMVADFFLFPAQCTYAFADLQLAMSFSALILTAFALASSVFLLLGRFVWARFLLYPTRLCLLSGRMGARSHHAY